LISALSLRSSIASGNGKKVLKIFENYCGARLTTHAFRIGGLIYELYDGFEQECRAFCDMFLPKVDEYEELLTNNRIWVSRLKGVGILSAEECKDYGVTGPVLRAAGVKWDLRKAQPYSGYEQYDFDIPTAQNGDTLDRYTVRMEEMRQSVRIIRQAVDKLQPGPIMGKVGKVIKPPTGEAYVSIEAPKGELGYYVVSDNSLQPYRISGAAAVVHQSAGARPHGAGRAGRGRGGHHRYA
jgi:NADH-quinone oxidoreductase subunit D